MWAHRDLCIFMSETPCHRKTFICSICFQRIAWSMCVIRMPCSKSQLSVPLNRQSVEHVMYMIRVDVWQWRLHGNTCWHSVTQRKCRNGMFCAIYELFIFLPVKHIRIHTLEKCSTKHRVSRRLRGKIFGKAFADSIKQLSLINHFLSILSTEW